MSLIPMLFSDWWEELDRPHRLWDQHFGLPVHPEDLLKSTDPLSEGELLLYRPNRRIGRRRFHPFMNSVARKTRGASIVQPDKDKFQVTLDVGHFAPEEISVKVVDKHIVVEAKHEEKEDEHGWISRQFVRKYLIPSQCDLDRVESQLSSDGVLAITVPRKDMQRSESNERQVKIQFTGKPAVTNYDFTGNSPSEKNQPNQQEQRQQQQQQQQQQQPQQGGPRGRKSAIKAA